MKKKLLGLIFMVLVVCTAPFSASADKCFRPWEDLSGKCGENVYYNYSKETKELIISGEGDMYDYGDYDSEIGASPVSTYIFDKVIIMDGVTSIGDGTFSSCDIYSISLPNSITKIGEYAFSNCGELNDIVIPDSVQSIGKWAFCMSGITNATIPEGVTTIEEKTFSNSSLTSISIPHSVQSIGRSAFENSNLTSISIPDSVTSMSANVFNETPYYNDESNWENGLLYIDNHLIGVKDTVETCYIKDSTVTIADCALDYFRTKAFVVAENCKYFLADDRGALFDKNKTRLIKYPVDNPATSYTIPDGVVSVDEYAFSDSSLKSVVIADSVTDIGAFAFAYNGDLECIYIGSGLKKIESLAFDHCYNIKEIHCPDLESWMNLEWQPQHEECCWKKVDYYFDGVLTKNLIIPDGYEEIPGIFAYGSFTSVTIPASVKNIGWQFYECKDITHVYYCGTEEQWNNIEIYSYNPILKATIVFDWLNHVHSYKSEVVVPATHFSIGEENMVCICGDSYTQDIPKIEEHQYNAVTTVPTCTAQGFTTYTCDCGVSYVDDYVPVLEHIDYDGDYKCDYGCGHEFEKPVPEEPEEKKNIIEKIIEWIKDFFSFDWLKKLFR